MDSSDPAPSEDQKYNRGAPGIGRQATTSRTGPTVTRELHRAGTFESFPSVAPLPDIWELDDRVGHWLNLFTALAWLVAIVGSVLGFFLIFENHDGHPLVGSLTVAAALLAAIIIRVSGRLYVDNKKGRISGSPSEARSKASEDERAINQESLKRYHDLTQRQTRNSYLIAQVAILTGLVVLVSGGIVVLEASVATIQVVVGSLAALGSALSGYVGATSIRMYNRAQAQMSFYYAQPLVQSYILEAERLSEKLSTDRRDVVLEKVIAQTLEVASLAANLIIKASEVTRPGRFRPGASGGSLSDVSPVEKIADKLGSQRTTEASAFREPGLSRHVLPPADWSVLVGNNADVPQQHRAATEAI